MRGSRLLAFIGLLLFAPNILAIDYSYKKADDFKTLENFETVEAFETSFGGYVQDCLDNTFGGTGGIPCYIADQLWDRELNIYYNKLLLKLDNRGKELLKKSQQEWVKSRDLAYKFSSHLLATHQQDGTMFSLMRARDFNEASAAMVKQRALWLKNWLELLSRPPIDESYFTAPSPKPKAQ